MLGQHGQFIDKTGRHGDQTKIAVSAWLAEDFSVGTYTMRQIEERVTSYAMLRNEGRRGRLQQRCEELGPHDQKYHRGAS